MLLWLKCHWNSCQVIFWQTRLHIYIKRTNSLQLHWTTESELTDKLLSRYSPAVFIRKTWLSLVITNSDVKYRGLFKSPRCSLMEPWCPHPDRQIRWVGSSVWHDDESWSGCWRLCWNSSDRLLWIWLKLIETHARRSYHFPHLSSALILHKASSSPSDASYENDPGLVPALLWGQIWGLWADCSLCSWLHSAWLCLSCRVLINCLYSEETCRAAAKP